VRFAVFLKTLRDLRWQVVWYGLGLAALAAVVVYIYPSYQQQFQDFEIPEALRALVGDADFASPEGFLATEFFSWVPILGVIFAIMAGTAALAGEETEGTLDLLLAQPLSRRRLALEKMAGIAVGTLLIVAITGAGWLISVPFVDMDVSEGLLLVATLELALIIFVFSAAAIWCGAMFPDRKVATGVVTAFAVASYFLNYLANLVEVIEPLGLLSVFRYAGSVDTITGSFEPFNAIVCLGLTGVFAAFALASFERRDLGVRGGGLTLPVFAISSKAEGRGA
jgi:ABC-2 type transport system permease protein